MGAVYKRGNIYWLKYYRNGKPYRESAKTRHKTDARRLLKNREAGIANGRLNGKPRIEIFNQIINEVFCINPNNRKIGKHLRIAILLRDGKRCVLCGANADNTSLQVDHIKPVNLGGLTIAENLQALCRECNYGKTNIFNTQSNKEVTWQS